MKLSGHRSDEYESDRVCHCSRYWDDVHSVERFVGNTADYNCMGHDVVDDIHVADVDESMN